MPYKLSVLIILTSNPEPAMRNMDGSAAPPVPSWYYSPESNDILLFTEIDDNDPQDGHASDHYTDQIFKRVLDWYRWNQGRVPSYPHHVVGIWVLGPPTGIAVHASEVRRRLKEIHASERQSEVERTEREQLRKLVDKYGAP